jgi:heme-degrading monooxygenase HmoA
MFVRISWLQNPPDQWEQRIAEAGQVAANFANTRGFLGLAGLADRATGAGIGVTYWDSAEAMEASEQAGENVRARLAEQHVQVKDVDRFEVLVQERTAPPAVNTFVRVNDLRGSPSKVDDLARYVRETAPAVLKAQSGFRALLMGANRQTGRMFITSVWATAADRDASNPAVQGMRDEAARIAGADSVTVELYESVIADIKQAALT